MRLLVFTACAVGLLLHVKYYWPFLCDDALISLRYALRLVEGHGLTWTDGPRVEGYTNLLWVLLNAGAGALGFDYIAAARVLGTLGVLLAIAGVGLSSRAARWSAARLFAGGGMLAASAPLAIWAVGGLEQGALAGALALALYCAERVARADVPFRRIWQFGLPLAAVALLRADGGVLVGAILLGTGVTLGWRRSTPIEVVLLGAPAGLAAAAQFAFRRLYYGEWLPNTAVAKVAFTDQRFELGLKYLREGGDSLSVLLALAVAATLLALAVPPRLRLLTPWVVIAVWSGYVGLVSGDVFPGWRQLVVVIVAACQLVAEGAESAHSLFGARALGLGAALVPLGALHVRVQVNNPDNQRAKEETWEFDGLAIGRVLKTAFAERAPLFALDEAGALAYASELPVIDMMGLNDYHIARGRPSTFGHGTAGHDLGDGRYVLGRKPDIVSFANAGGFHKPVFLSGSQLMSLPEFRRRYQWIRLQSNEPGGYFGEAWIRRDGKVGIDRTEERVDVPGYLFTGQASAAAARLDSENRLVAYLTSDQPGNVVPFELPRGRWRVQVVANSTPYRLTVRCDGRTMQRLRIDGETVIEVDGAARIGFSIAPQPSTSGLLLLRRIRLTRENSALPTLRCVESGRPLEVVPSELSTPQLPGSPWDGPLGAVVSRSGLVMSLGQSVHATSVALSVDSNDNYTIELLRREEVVWRQVLGPSNTPGLAVHQLSVPGPVSAEGFDGVRVSPGGGDGHYSIGHLKLHPN